MTFDPYDELELDRAADNEMIQAAARKHAKTHHPDKGGDSSRFNAGRRALAVLSDPVSRKKFDETGEMDDQKIDNDLASAMQIVIAEIQTMVGQYINQNYDVRYNPRFLQDLTKRMTLSIQIKMDEGYSAIAKATKEIDFLKDFAPRFRIKDEKTVPFNFIQRTIDKQIKDLQGDIAKVEESMRKHKLAIELIRSYDFRADP
jgi:curved DNA-binding protein CbpA